MNIGIVIFSGISVESQVENMKKVGINRTFVSSEIHNFDNVMDLFRRENIICETLHAPFNRINDMWSHDRDAGDCILNRLKDSIDKCCRYGVPVSVVHLSSKCPMPEINEIGIERFDKLFAYAEEKGIIIALENQRYLENIDFFMKRHPEARFCYDVGHEHCFTSGIDFMDHFGDRLVALHIHDNSCIYNADDHLLPFDGKIDYSVPAKKIAESGFTGTLMLEVEKTSSVDDVAIYEHMSNLEYYSRAADAANKLAAMVDSYR